MAPRIAKSRGEPVPVQNTQAPLGTAGGQFNPEQMRLVMTKIAELNKGVTLPSLAIARSIFWRDISCTMRLGFSASMGRASPFFTLGYFARSSRIGRLIAG